MKKIPRFIKLLCMSLRRRILTKKQDRTAETGRKVSIENHFGEEIVRNVPKWEALKQKGAENDVDEGLKSCYMRQEI